jgi:thiol-disulfide isomerase/thioredoxin
MKKKILAFILLLGVIIPQAGCKNQKEGLENYNYTGLAFKETYEVLNGTTNSKGLENRTISIDKDNPMITVDDAKIVDLINNKETFYVYFGFPSCPWCRSVIEKAIEVAKKNNIDKIYYVNILDIRDTLEVNGTTIETVKEGSENYYKLIDLLKDVLSEYKLTDIDGNQVDASEKRIYAPNFIYVENGKAKKMIEGISSKQTESRMELSSEILQDEEEAFEEFFSQKG